MGEMNEQAHRLLLEQRKTLSLGGVQDVKSFDENEVLLVTVCGVLTIRGKELHVGRLELEKGEADIEGSIDSLVYTEHGPLQKKENRLMKYWRLTPEKIWNIKSMNRCTSVQQTQQKSSTKKPFMWSAIPM